MAQWPTVLSSDLVSFTNISNRALSCNMYTNYKQGKGYSSFQDGWIGVIESNITAESNICYFLTKCRVKGLTLLMISGLLTQEKCYRATVTALRGKISHPMISTSHLDWNVNFVIV